MSSTLLPAGTLGLEVQRTYPARELSMAEIARFGLPHLSGDADVNRWRARNIPNLMRGLKMVAKARALGIPHYYGQLFLKVNRPDGSELDLGLASLRVVTTAGVNFLVGILNGTNATATVFKYHGIGTGTNAEASADTALQTELTTQYNPDNTRATGSLTTGGSANVFRTIGTNTVDAAVSITEHGIFTQAATGGGTLLDRSVFSAVALSSGDSLQSTYDLTFNAGG